MAIPPSGVDPSDQSDSFRAHLIAADQTASRDYDKALLTLSAGSLGVSIAFIHTVAPHPKDIFWLGLAWGLFAASLVFVVSSLLTSQRELRKAITAYDNQTDESPAVAATSSATAKLNFWAGMAFLVGVVALVVFAFLNLRGK
jgi:hypothetical protein